jgi:3-keto-5-aminohexanoate cleavage enzyme
MDKLIINAAITGMIPTRQMSPYVPITPDEVIADVKRCRDAGASIVHVHARDENGRPTYHKDIYTQIFAGIRAECPDMLISGSTSGRNFREFWQRSEVLEPAPGLRPDFGSLTLGSLNFPTGASVNEPEMIKALATAMNDKGIVPEWEIFDMGMADYGCFLASKGILRKPFYGNILLGSLGMMNATPFNLASVVRSLPEGMVWSAAGIGRFQAYVTSMAVTMGGHVRVGLEDNIYHDPETKKHPATNAGLIEGVVKVARAIGREIASPADARSLIGLPARPAQASPAAMEIRSVRTSPGGTSHGVQPTPNL